MSDLLSNLTTLSPWLIPLVFLGFGLTSSLHCVGMCGPLSLLAAHGSKSSWKYHFGRLLGYMAIATILSFLGRETLNLLLHKLGTWFWYFLASVVVISFLIFWARKYGPRLKFLNTFSQKMMAAAMKQKNQSAKSFAIGVSSVFLPCGVLYLAIISLVALSSPLLSVFGVLFFWAGTLPLMHFGLPQLKKLLDRFSMRAAQVNTFFVIFLSALVLFARYPHVIEEIVKHCH